jgi:hypothetical protein
MAPRVAGNKNEQKETIHVQTGERWREIVKRSGAEWRKLTQCATDGGASVTTAFTSLVEMTNVSYQMTTFFTTADVI